MMIQFIPVQGGAHAFPESSCDPSGCLSTGKGSGCVIAVGSDHVCVLSFEDGLGGDDETGVRIAASAAGCGILMPEIEDGGVRMVLRLPGPILEDRGLIVEILIPRFLAGVHANPEEDGREYDRTGNFRRLPRG
ncbi:MAG: hypothetical protein F9K32_02650 [Desulfobulbaceae bacterium]|nr:MAG: hypothetical protein F9K32_02650 [Desulfobulbaceae bacterium]